jgi:hypothetical protein
LAMKELEQMRQGRSNMGIRPFAAFARSAKAFPQPRPPPEQRNKKIIS